MICSKCGDKLTTYEEEVQRAHSPDNPLCYSCAATEAQMEAGPVSLEVEDYDDAYADAVEEELKALGDCGI